MLVRLGFMTAEEFKTHCIELQNGMYGQVDAALRFFVRFVGYLVGENCNGIVQSKADPCVFYKKDANGFPIMASAVTVDDCLLGGYPKELDIFMSDIEKQFNIVKELEVKKHLGINYDFKRDENNDIYALCTMKDKVDDIVKSYEEFIGENVKTYASPGAPNSVLNKNEGETHHIDKYRSLVGTIMFFATKVGPKICNQVRDLARHMANPGIEHWTALGRLVGFMKGMESKGMRLSKPVDLRTVSLVDSDFAKDPVTR